MSMFFYMLTGISIYSFNILPPGYYCPIQCEYHASKYTFKCKLLTIEIDIKMLHLFVC